MDNSNQQSPNEPATEQPHSSSKPSFHSKTILVTIILFGLVLVSLLTLLLGSRNKNTYQPPPSTLSPTIPAISPAPNGVGANWKTYTNTKYGYEVMYPKEIPLEETQYGVWIDKQIWISVSPKSNTIVHGDGPAYETSENIKVANLDAKLYTGYHGSMEGQPQRFIEVEINHNNYTYNLHLYALKQDNDLPHDDEIKEIPDNEIMFFYQILSTFKFLPASTAGGDQNQTIDTSNWKTYQGLGKDQNNKPYSFTIKYPPEWQMEEDILYPLGKQRQGIYSPVAFVLHGPGHEIPEFQEIKEFPAGQAKYYWGDTGNPALLFGYASFEFDKGFVWVDSVSKTQGEKYHKIFDAMLSTYKILY